MKKKNSNSIINYLICLYILLLPFEEAIAFGGITLLRIISILIIILSLIVTRGRIKLDSFVLPLMLWMVFCFISFFWSISISESWKYYKIYLIQFALIVSVYSLPKNIINLESINKSFIFSSFIASSLILMSPSSIITKEGRRAITLFGSTLDPNIVSGIIIIGALLAVVYFVNTNGIKRFIWLALIGYEVFCALLTGSRGGFLSLVFGIVVLLFIYRKSFLTSIKSYFILILVIIVVVIIIRLMPTILIESRFSTAVLFGQNEIGVHSRTTIWSYIPNLFNQKPLFGWGAGTFPKAMEAVYRYSAGHNMYFIVLVETGVVGFGVFFWFLIKLLVEVKNASINILIMLSSILFSCIFLDGLTDKYVWAAFILCAIYIANVKRMDKQYKEE